MYNTLNPQRLFGTSAASAAWLADRTLETHDILASGDFYKVAVFSTDKFERMTSRIVISTGVT